MVKEIVKYSKLGAAKSKARTAWKGFSKGGTTEQVFLGKTLPRMALGAAKLAWKHPITTTAAWLIGKKLLETKPGLKFPKHRQFDKRGRKFI